FHQGALIVEADPLQPSLEEMRGGRIQLEVRGPIQRRVTCRLVLFETSETPLLIKKLPTLSLPITAEKWRSYIVKQFQAQDVEGRINAAHSCRIDLEAEELGSYSFICERQFTPLRWAIRRNARNYFITLADDTGACDQTKVWRFDFKTPDHKVDLPNSS